MNAGLVRLRRRLLRRTLLLLSRSRFSYRGARFVVPQGVLNPTTFRASFGFARAALASAPLAPAAVLELGSGAGVAAVLLARAGHRVTAVDLDPAAVVATASNARRNSVRVHTVNGDWDSALALGHHFDLVISNPPFLPTEPPAHHLALYGGAELEVVRAAVCAAARRLGPNGRVVLLTSERSGRTKVRALFAEAGLGVVDRRDFSSWGEQYHVDILGPLGIPAQQRALGGIG